MEMNPEIFTADYLGKPGERTFFLQSRSSSGINSFLIEKTQVALLAEKLREMLVLIDQGDTIRAAVPARDPALSMSEPVEPEWRVGTIGLGYEEDGDRIVVLLQPVEPEQEQDAPQLEDDALVPGGDVTRLYLRRDQVRSFVLHAVAVVAEGRPICQLCGLPMDPAGHKCPASNGHNLGTLNV
jgi:uncharacterized repeat protein (TIGR03847 family)